MRLTIRYTESPTSIEFEIDAATVLLVQRPERNPAHIARVTAPHSTARPAQPTACTDMERPPTQIPHDGVLQHPTTDPPTGA